MHKLCFTVMISLLLTACGTTSNNSYHSGYSHSSTSAQGSLTKDQKSEVAMFAFSLLDTKYNWGSKKPAFGLDCSGLVSYVFRKSVNIELTGAARDIVKHGQDIPVASAVNKNLEVGDLLFFNTTGTPYSHVGIYVGNNSFLHASSGKGKVIISNVNQQYYISRLERIKRI